MDVVMGLLAAVFWGATDFLVGVNARNVGIKRAVFFGQLLGLMIMSIILLLSSGYSKILAAPPHALVFGVVASCFTLTGALAISKAFALGKTAVVAPLVTSYGVFTALFSWWSGESISSSQLAGILICVCGVVLASLKERATKAKPTQNGGVAIFFAVLAALLYGSSFWLQGKFALPSLGAPTMLWLGYAVGIAMMAPTFLSSAIKAELGLPPKAALAPLCAASIFNLGGFSAFAWGALNGSISIVTVISTLSGGIAALMGYVFYKETLSPVQLAGILLVLAGAAVLHAYG
ncbi:DMT family transporter [Pseudomonas sp. F3-2]|uniref:DMT family transporter n=1 Tax=Pseudomonas sp. F3-2 TaxID=3141539 RepID=UPI00315D3917